MDVYVYVIAASEKGPCKIGYSQDPSKRLRQLQTGHAEKLTLYHTSKLDKKHAVLVEKAVHRNVKFDRSHGEWFNLSVSDAIAEVDFATITWGGT